MALFEDVLKHGGGAGLAIGVGALVAPAVLSAVGQLLRPAAKALIKGGMVLYEDARNAAGELTNEAAAAAPARADERPQRRPRDNVKAVTAARADDMAVAANKAPARRGRPRKATTRMAKKPG
jgi:hypothetical protein